jgi:multiple sugar transport system permease protein
MRNNNAELPAMKVPLGLSRPRFGLGMRRRRQLKHTLVYLLITLFLAVALMPLAWVISTSLQSLDQLRVTYPIQWIPKPLFFANYPDGWHQQPWLLYLRNTLIVALGSATGELVSTIPVSYAFARMKFRGRAFLTLVNISLMLLPGQVTMVPTFILFSRLGWIGTFKPVIIPFWFGFSAWSIFLLTQFFRTIPEDLSDAARIDGADEFTIMTKVILPLCKPILAVLVVFHITWVWNDYLTAIIYLKDTAHRPLVLGLQWFIGQHGEVGWGPLMAMSVLIALPIVPLYFFVQRYITGAFVTSGLKG